MYVSSRFVIYPSGISFDSRTNSTPEKVCALVAEMKVVSTGLTFLAIRLKNTGLALVLSISIYMSMP